MRSSRRAFTLVEMLVVVAIIGLVMSILAPSFMSVTDLARETSCKNNLSLLSKAAFGYMGANSDVLPMNDSGTTIDYKDFDSNGMLPGADSTPKWWCNKVYSYGSRMPRIYICPSDPGRANDADPVQCGYGFNNTLTNPKDASGTGTDAAGLGYKTIYEVTDPERTAIVGHCSDYDRKPAIIEGMIDVAAPASPTGWPVGHLKRADFMGWSDKGNYVNLGVVGRCGFIMGNGFVKVRKYSEVLQLKVKDGKNAGKLVIFGSP
jgi:prepilin-type N-terminal cleavage/methylation domain-containing protein